MVDDARRICIRIAAYQIVSDRRILEGGSERSNSAARGGRVDLYVADRVKDVIVTGGENVYSIEVERALFMHPAVREAAVVGIPSEQWGEAVHAVIALKDGAKLRVPQRAVAGDSVGKARKNVLRDAYWIGHARKI
jgi:acyl-CoA synthetase (AMP-forming)/AMP-acid ligase II